MYCLGDDDDGEGLGVIETMSEDELPPAHVLALLGGDVARIFQRADETDAMLGDLVAKFVVDPDAVDPDDE